MNQVVQRAWHHTLKNSVACGVCLWSCSYQVHESNRFVLKIYLFSNIYFEVQWCVILLIVLSGATRIPRLTWITRRPSKSCNQLPLQNTLLEVLKTNSSLHKATLWCKICTPKTFLQSFLECNWVTISACYHLWWIWWRAGIPILLTRTIIVMTMFLYDSNFQIEVHVCVHASCRHNAVTVSNFIMFMFMFIN